MAKASSTIDISALKVAGIEPYKYITTIDSDDGIQVHAANNSGLNYIQITSDGMDVFRANKADDYDIVDVPVAENLSTYYELINNEFVLTEDASIDSEKTYYIFNPRSAISIAEFGEDIRIGKETDRNVYIDNEYVHIRDGQNDLAYFGTESRMGNSESYHTDISDSSFKISNADDEILDINATGETQSKSFTNQIFPTTTNCTGTRTARTTMSYGITYTIKVNDANSFTVSASSSSNLPSSNSVTVGSCITDFTFAAVENKYQMTVTQHTNSSSPVTYYNVTRAYTKTYDVPVLEFAGDIKDKNGSTVSKAYCFSTGITATSITAQNTNTKVPITSIDIARDFTYDSTNKGVKCGKSGRYFVSLWLASDSTATTGDIYGVGVLKNGSSLVDPAYHRLAGTYDTVQMPPTYMNFLENDVITIYVRNNTSARGKVTNCRFAIWEVG